jgi:preprotein translocase subunit SecG
METVLWIIHVVVSLSLIGLVLMQPGQSGGMGTAFGGGGSQTLFGSGGSSGFLSRATAVLAAVFFLTSLGLAYLALGGQESSVVDQPATPMEGAPPEGAGAQNGAQGSQDGSAGGGGVPAIPADPSQQ